MAKTQGNALDQRIVAGLAKISLVLRHHARVRGARFGLTPTQAQILAVLTGRPSTGVSIGDIAAELAVSQPTISDSIAALKRKGLVRSKRSRSDARVVLVRPTRKGQRAAASHLEWPDALRQIIHDLDPSEQSALLQILIKTIRALQESGQIPMARMCPSCRFFRPHAHTNAVRPHHCDFVDAPLGGTDLRLDCTDHEVLPSPDQQRVWSLFVRGRPCAGGFPASST